MPVLLTIALAVFTALCYVSIGRWLNTSGCPTPRRTALLWCTVALGVAIVVVTEGLSLFHGLSRGAVFLSWIAFSIALACELWRRYRPLSHPPVGTGQLGFTGWVSAAGLFAILSVTLVVALVAPPNTWDSMTYHMSRVMHWIQNGSVEFYATATPRQLWTFPGAEYAILNLQLLAGSDRLANMVQWWASEASAVGGSLIVRRFDARPSVQAGGAPRGGDADGYHAGHQHTERLRDRLLPDL
ncbi:MAG: hypothetical protein GY953_22730, partial [bacterium]|nr:hypothetical protein [bacterium]